MKRREMRHIWGIYFRSNLDWDWDTGSCLERLLEIPEEEVPLSIPIAIVSLDIRKANAWNVYTESSLPEEVKVAYKSPTGETKYKIFVLSLPSDDVASASSLANIVEETEVSIISLEQPCGGVEDVSKGDLALVVEEKEELSVIAPGPSCRGIGDVREGSRAAAAKDNDTLPAPSSASGMVANCQIVKCTTQNDKNVMLNHMAILENDYDLRSVRSLDLGIM